MKTLKAHVRAGRLLLDEPCELPEGTEVDLAFARVDDDLDAIEREALDTALEASWASARAGRTYPAEDLLARLRTKP